MQRLNQKGYRGQNDVGKLTRSNRLYYACEAAETMIMCCTFRLVRTCRIHSIVWLHDGMYIHNGLPQEIAIRAFSEATHEAGIPQAQTKITQCGTFEIPVTHAARSDNYHAFARAS